MSKLPIVIPVSDLRQDVASVLKLVRGSREPLIVTQRGRAAAVLMSVETYERSSAERELLRMLARGDREIAAGQGHSLDDVLREADAILADGES